MVYFGESEKIGRISRKMDISDTSTEFSSDISFCIPKFFSD